MISKISKVALIACLAFGLGNTVYAAQAVSMAELLEQVKQCRVKDAAENKARIDEFQRNRARQQQNAAGDLGVDEPLEVANERILVRSI